jgi:hypothetical protein
VDGGAFVNATDASLINEAGSGQVVSQIPAVPALPAGVSLTFGGPDPYLYLSAVQASPGQTVTETLYLDVTDPNGIQLTALDEAIGFDASEMQISNVRSAAELEGLGSYATASAEDNGSGVLLVGQAFMGAGLPPVVPYGTKVAVLEFDVSVDADATVGDVTGLTLLQDGEVNGQLKYTAISDNDGALPFTAGMSPTNSGNAAIDGSVTVVPVAAPVVTEPVITKPEHPVNGGSKSVVSVRRVTSTTPTSSAAESVVSVVMPLVSDVGPRVDETVATDVGPLTAAPVVIVQPDMAIAPISVSAGVAMETVQVTNVGSTSHGGDAASLSLAAVGTNRTTSVAATGSSTGKMPTNVLDEMYRLLGTGTQIPGSNPASGGDDAADEMADVWDLEYSLFDLDISGKTDDRDGE